MAGRVALSAFIALIVAMGIGRFTFTPQVPLMIADGQLTLTSAAVVAAFNYLGYLCGSWHAMRTTTRVEAKLKAGIGGAVMLTLLSACVSDAWLHGLVRFVIGWASGWTMVLVAAWSNDRLHKYGRPGLSAAVFAGPGAGIFLSGLLAVFLHAQQVSAAQAWCAYGVLALILVLPILRFLPRKGELHRPETAPEPLLLTSGLKKLVWSYSLAGFGYIIPATFMSQMATARFPDSAFAQFVWPVFGGTAVLGVGLGILLRRFGCTNTRLALNLWTQALGVFCAALVPGLSGLIVGSVLMGMPFLNLVYLSLQYAREMAPLHSRYMAGLLTTGYAVGQLTGPLVSALSTTLSHRLEPALYVAGASLLLAGTLVWRRDTAAT
ncbi:YbfB/YjiJ family MFS transporter [Erwinia sp. CGal63]|uniref:YbfB/YjiJ family MFS transporter n=1 Tax=Erwinia sp. CGal63 TaxID=2919889 RepID=UPI00300A2542